MKFKNVSILGLALVLAVVLLGLTVEVKANTSINQGFSNSQLSLSKTVNGTCTAVYGRGYTLLGGVEKIASFRGGWSERSFSNVEIWVTTVPAVSGVTSPKLVKTGAYIAGTVEGVKLIGSPSLSNKTNTIIFDTNINGVCDTKLMESSSWTSASAGAYEYQPDCAYDCSLHTKLSGPNNLYGAYTNLPISGKYKIGVGSNITTPYCELYYFYQYWDGGVLKRKHLKQTSYSKYTLVDSDTWTPIISKTKISGGRIIMPGTVAKVPGRTYYVGVDYSLDGIHNSGYDIEVPALP